MGLQTVAPDVLMTCPLDEAHRILKSRMQFHLVRCLKNHTLEKKIRCPWNPLHIVNRFEYLDHCNSKCEDLTNVMGSTILSEDEANRDVASIPVNATNAVLPEAEENWDTQLSSGTYDPLKKSENKPILRASIGLSKAKKKAFTLQERKRHQKLEDDGPIQASTSKLVEKLDSIKACRPLRKQQIAMSIDVSLKDESNSNIDDDNVFTKLLTSLRQPHKPGSALIYEAIKDEAVEEDDDENNVKLFDAQFDSECYGSDASFRESHANFRYGNSIALRKYIESSSKGKKKSFAGVASCNGKKVEENESINVDETKLLDEASNLPKNRKKTKGVKVDELAEQLANLESMQLQLNETKRMILQELQRSENTCSNSELDDALNIAKGNTSSKPENGTVTNIDTPAAAKYEQVFNNRKCAANFGKTKKMKNLPIVGTGRGIVVDFEDFQNIRPGSRGNRENNLEMREYAADDTKENANPFLSVTDSGKNDDTSKESE